LASALVGDFGAIVRLGLMGVLSDADISCVGEAVTPNSAAQSSVAQHSTPQSPATDEGFLLQRLDCAQPDVVVVDWDDRRYEAVAASVLARRPSITVIACSDERLSMRVIPGRQDRGVYESRLSAQGLVEAVKAASAR